MPTGYTSSIEKGISFEQFVLQCARAFGACVTMKDESFDAQIPAEFKPSKYHLGEIARLEKELASVQKMSISEAEKQAEADYDADVKDNKRRIAECRNLKAKYEAMIEKVRAWQPPTSEHKGLKDFMIEQITTSIEHDCDTEYWEKQESRKITGAAWKLEKIRSIKHDIAYHIKEHKEEVDRCVGRTKWVNDLRKSLKKGI